MLVEKLTRKELEQWAAISWAVWNARNKVYFEKVQLQPKVIVEGGVHSTGNLPKALCLSRVSLTQCFDGRPGNMQLLECIKWGWVFSCLVCVFLGNVGMGLLLLVCVFVC